MSAEGSWHSISGSIVPLFGEDYIGEWNLFDPPLPLEGGWGDTKPRPQGRSFRTIARRTC